MNRLKPHLALLVCNVLWAMDYPFYNIVLPHYVHPMAMVAGSLVVTALFSLVPLLWQKAEKVERADIRKLIGAALLIGVLRKVFIMYGLSMTSPIDGSIIDTIVPLLVLALSVLLGMDRFTRLKITGLVLGMAGAVAGAVGVPATAAVLLDADTGQVLYEKNGDEQMLIASTTKIMTALVVLEQAGLDDTVTVTCLATEKQMAPLLQDESRAFERGEATVKDAWSEALPGGSVTLAAPESYITFGGGNALWKKLSIK